MKRLTPAKAKTMAEAEPDIRRFLTKHPGSTMRAIADAVGASMSTVEGVLSKGYLKGEVVKYAVAGRFTTWALSWDTSPLDRLLTARLDLAKVKASVARTRVHRQGKDSRPSSDPPRKGSASGLASSFSAMYLAGP